MRANGRPRLIRIRVYPKALFYAAVWEFLGPSGNMTQKSETVTDRFEAPRAVR